MLNCCYPLCGSAASSRVSVSKHVETSTSEKCFSACAGVKVIAEYAHLDSKLSAICESPKFVEWIAQFSRQNQITMKEFHVTDADFFGPVKPSRLGFVKGFGIASDAATGDLIPAIAFIRGGSIAVLIIVSVKETGQKYVLLCKQLRFPSGGAKIEACAGMVDDCTSAVIGVVFNEVKEETGFSLSAADLIDLGTITPSAGGCDEIIHLYAWETSTSAAEFAEKQEKVFGAGKYERIKLIFYRYEEFESVLDDIGDVKAECCWRRYQKRLKIR
jgi:8-oxo-dGTP pyrophosphatase MutT (NUDIX family)